MHSQLGFAIVCYTGMINKYSAVLLIRKSLLFKQVITVPAELNAFTLNIYSKFVIRTSHN